MGVATEEFVGKLNDILFTRPAEKTFVDKILDRQDVERIRQLMRKEELNRNELLELLYLLAGIEVKLCNMGEWDRYLLGKYFAWIRDFVSLAEAIFDYMQDPDVQLDEESEKLLENIRKNITHAVKFNADVYLYLLRSTLSLGGAGFDTLTKTRFEYFYPSETKQEQQPQQKSFFSFFLR